MTMAVDHVLMWDENKVTKWISTLGYSSLEKQFKEQGITGEILVNLDHEALRDLSVLTVGQRMDILKNIYQLKIHYRVPLNEWDYIPPSVLYETDWLGQNGMADYRKIEAAFQERDARIKRLTEDLGRINNDMSILKDELSQLLKMKDKKNDKVTNQKVYPLLSKHSNSPTIISSLHSNSDYTHRSNIDSLDDPKSTPNVMINDGGAIKVYGDKISKIEHEPEHSKNVRLLLDDPTSKVIMSALKKYNVMSDWQQYALWIQYGSPDNIQERALGYDERPLRISQKLKEAKQNSVFVLKHVKDNKPFIPPNTHNYSYPRPAPKPQYINDTSELNRYNSAKEKQAQKSITSGRVGYEVVVPVMSSSISTPTSSPQQHPTLSSSNSSTTMTTGNKRPMKQTLEYNNELGLDNAVVNAIFSINNGTQDTQ
ncbi:hypothetical protein BDB01DRAFT_798967 [Pilobolus umbonatus]|nr:hypothetical protein BDB01DRAFT_798967 [Pilobolus umbonatus]